ncbi:MAG: gamma-glutamyltransferase [Ignavibacteriaceae bacterium]|nr:gamma-glutamyltransferase [Ignavibacteriaceae bacterium]
MPILNCSKYFLLWLLLLSPVLGSSPDPVIGNYRSNEIISTPPLNSGGIALNEMLKVTDNYRFNKDDFGSSYDIHKLVETIW